MNPFWLGVLFGVGLGIFLVALARHVRDLRDDARFLKTRGRW